MIRRRRLIAVATVLVVAGAVTAVALSAGSPMRRPNSAPAPAVVSTQGTNPRTTRRPTPVRRPVRPPAPRITGVRRFALTLSEPSAASIATGRSPSGQPVRILPTVVRYPIVTGGAGRLHFPLVVFSQGFNEPAEAYSGLMHAWARAGYVVAAPTYPLTDPSMPGGVNESDIVNHPADLRYVISALRSAGGDPHSPLYRVVDPHQVAIVGQSDGGDVSLATAANSCCRDPAVRAAMILSGAELSAFGGTYYSGGRSVPLLVTQGSSDTINFPGCSSQLYDQAPPPKYYLDIVGAPHLPPYVDPGPTRHGIAVATIAFLNAFLKHHPAGLAHVRARLPAGETLSSGPTAPAPASPACPGAP